MRIDSLSTFSHFPSFFAPSLSFSYNKYCLILSQNVKYGTFVANVTKNLTYTLWEKNCVKFAARKFRKLWGPDCSIVLNRGVAGTIWKYVEFRIIYSWELHQKFKFKNSCLISKSLVLKPSLKVNVSMRVWVWFVSLDIVSKSLCRFFHHKALIKVRLYWEKSCSDVIISENRTKLRNIWACIHLYQLFKGTVHQFSNFCS